MPAGLAEEAGYVEEEYFIAGDSVAYEADGELGSDGQWTVTEGETAPYETRVIVRRPEDPAEFSGVVVVEWLNVSAGRDSDPTSASSTPSSWSRATPTSGSRPRPRASRAGEVWR